MNIASQPFRVRKADKGRPRPLGEDDQAPPASPSALRAYGQCIPATSTEDSPWYIVPTDNKDSARLNVSQFALDAPAGLRMRYPVVSVARRRELLSIRRQLAK